jgi:hypothetical protein
MVLARSFLSLRSDIILSHPVSDIKRGTFISLIRKLLENRMVMNFRIFAALDESVNERF